MFNKEFIKKTIFWLGLFIAGLAAFIAGLVIMVLDDNKLMWLPISLGLIAWLLGLLFTVYLSIVEYKRKVVREDIKSKGI